MKNFKKVVITGVTGQDGSYMADYLLENTDCEIFGAIRRLSVDNHINIEGIKDNPRFHLIEMDLCDSESIECSVREIQPDYYINFAANSFVGTSWKLPVNHFQSNTMAVLHQLEAIRKHAPHCRYYNSGSSEEYGNVAYTPQDENHPLNPRSPYGASKASARHIVKVWRESYGLFAIQGHLFNHECLTAQTPVILKNKNTGLIDIKPIKEIVPHRTKPNGTKKYTSVNECEYLVWDGNRWEEIITRTATWNDRKNDKKVLRVMARGGFYEATEDHISFKNGQIETKTKSLKIGNELELKNLPELTQKSLISQEEAEFLGLMSAEGWVSSCGKGRFTNKDENLCNKIKDLWSKLSIGYTSENISESGYTGKKDIKNINLLGDANYLKSIKNQLYTKSEEKRVPQKILNADRETMLAYLRGYNYGDGLKAGNQNSEFQGFTTNSYTLSAGLCYLLHQLDFRFVLCPEERGDKIYFKININVKNSQKGHHLKKSLNEITKISKLNYEGWLFDLETTSGTFSAGVGFSWVHNSPRRGVEFVTRKISMGVARIREAIRKGESFEPIEVGNLYAKRDWSHAKDFVRGIWMMLNQETLRKESVAICSLKEYVLSSNETHTVKEFIEIAFSIAGLKGEWVGEGVDERYIMPCDTQQGTINLVKINPDFYRPAEVELLLGDSTKARTELGWKPDYNLEQLVKEMVDNDIKLVKNKANTD